MAKSLRDRIDLAATRLAQLQARRRLTEQAERTRVRKLEKRTQAKTVAALLRSADAHKKISLGGVVIAAGADDLDAAELCGLLLDGQDRLNNSPTIRLALRKRGLDYLDARRAASQLAQ